MQRMSPAKGSSTDCLTSNGAMQGSGAADKDQLKCNVEQEPFSPCARCRHHKLECKIDSAFKRVGKRSRHAEIERRIVELELENAQLRERLASRPTHTYHATTTESATTVPYGLPASPTYTSLASATDTPLASDEAVASLMKMKNGTEISAPFNGTLEQQSFRTIGKVSLPEYRVLELFREYFDHYHQFLPLLNPDWPPDQYYETSSLLFWTIICVSARRFDLDPDLLEKLTHHLMELVWSTVGDVPQNYHMVKSLCILCTWPLPISRSSTDSTFILAGVMMHIALQVGLHRPSHAQDFSRMRVQLKDGEIQDRAKTWVACIVVAQT